MNTHHEAPRFSVYLGRGLYIGGIVNADPSTPETVALEGAPDGAAISIAFVGQAAKYGRDAAVRVCHVARRAGVRAWLVNHPAVSV